MKFNILNKEKKAKSIDGFIEWRFIKKEEVTNETKNRSINTKNT